MKTEVSDGESEIEDRCLAAAFATGRLPASRTTKAGTITHINNLFVNKTMTIEYNTFKTNPISPRWDKNEIELPHKRDDLKKRDDFFYQTLNGAHSTYHPTCSTNASYGKLFSVKPISKMTRPTSLEMPFEKKNRF